MSRGLWLVLACLMCFAVSVSADSETMYQLVTPTADEYLTAIPSILWGDEYNYGDMSAEYADLIHLTWAELRHYDVLSKRPYKLLKEVHPYYSNSYFLGGISQDLFTAWLRETHINLSNFDADHPLTFDDFVIKVTPRDFDVDGKTEWVLDISHEDRFKWWEVVSITEEGRYQSIARLGYFDSYATYWLESAGFQEEIAFEDLNQDGLPEWVIAVGGYGGGHKSHGYLYVLQWKDGDLTSPQNTVITYSAPAGGGTPLFPHGVTVNFRDSDGNGTIEIVVQQRKYNNWTCTWTQTRVYGWNVDRYILLSNVDLNDEVKGCAWQAAEQAMWASDFKTAITEYEQALTLPFADDFTHPYWTEYSTHVWEYIQARLALAYALVNQPENSEAALNNLYQAGIQSDAAWQMSAVLLQRIGHSSPVEMCQAMYDLWFSYVDAPPEDRESDATQYANAIPTLALVSYTHEFEPNGPWPLTPTPEKAGCDITAFGHPLSITLYDQQHPVRMALPERSATSYYGPTRLSSAEVIWNISSGHQHRLLIQARFLLMQSQQGLVGEDEWMARYLFATALRQNNRLDEALEQYVYIYENTPVSSMRELAGLYLKPIGE